MINNVNEVRQPCEDVEWIPENVGDNTEVRRQGGIDYLIDDKNKYFKLTGTATFLHNDQFHNNNTSSVNFWSGGDTYSLSHAYRRLHLWGIFSYHIFDFNWDKVKLSIKPQLEFNKNNDRISKNSGSFSSDSLQYVGKQLLDSLFNSNVSSTLLTQTLNRTHNKEQEKRIDLNTKLFAELTAKIPHTSDHLAVNAEICYSMNRSDDFTHDFYDYPTQTQPTDFRNGYNRGDSHSYNLALQTEYYHLLNDKNWYLVTSYQFKKSYKNTENNLYRLDWLKDWGEDGENELGDLPSLTDWKRQTLDGNNSIHTILDNYDHTFAININKYSFNKNYWTVRFSLPLTLNRTTMDYERPMVIDTTLKRNIVTFSPIFKVENYWLATDSMGNIVKMHHLNLNLTSENTPQDLSYKINLPNTTNPLAIYMGNANLHSTWKHTFSTRWQYNKYVHDLSISLTWLTHIMQHALCMGYTYDRQTGRQIYTPNCEWELGHSNLFHLYFLPR